MKTQYITDDHGKRLAVVLPIKLYEKMIEELEESEDIRLFKKAKEEDEGERILLSDYIRKRQKQ